MSISQPVYEAQIERISGQEERITELEAELADVKDELAKAKNVPAKMRFIACGYCGEKLHEYQDNDPSPSEHREALQKFRAHDARCDANPIKRERDALLEVVVKLERAERLYRREHDAHGDASVESGKAWTHMRRMGNAARAALAKVEGRDDG